ncbi:hypothetical protein [Terrihabitans rhizophilus]|jgi:hypothetical protein|uniref:CopG family transcriptional regulator n=1 Tax=Terrihabitans rhizophilus TaxID=3092662 RepID=A0ABU4RWJ2_9HYPH|nr:hypothetical protein [Terrihabitans sp. PJ23]MDX6807241.1 hypothetical protein [Terrihabitans sp. PJ23]
MQISDSVATLVNIPVEIDDVLNEWIAEQRDPTLTKAGAINLAVREYLLTRGLLNPPGPLQQVDDDMLKLVEKAFSDEPRP